MARIFSPIAPPRLIDSPHFIVRDEADGRQSIHLRSFILRKKAPPSGEEVLLAEYIDEAFTGDHDFGAPFVFPARITRVEYLVGGDPSTTSMDIILKADGVPVAFGGLTTLSVPGSLGGGMPSPFTADPGQTVNADFTFTLVNHSAEAFLFDVFGIAI